MRKIKYIFGFIRYIPSKTFIHVYLFEMLPLSNVSDEITELRSKLLYVNHFYIHTILNSLLNRVEMISIQILYHISNIGTVVPYNQAI